jgi:RND family efflux transporter MFP subunit
MKSKLINKQTGIFLAIVVSILFVSIFTVISISSAQKEQIKTASVSAKTVDSQIIADGTVRSLNEATLHFQTGGKVTYLPFKEGDTVRSGQTIASLDTYTIQKQLQSSLNTYRSVRDTFDQTHDNSQTNILQGQQRLMIDNQTKSGLTGTTEENAINDIVKRVVDQNQANLDNAVIQVQLANYAFTLASIASPIDGTIVHEDITNANLNVTPQTSFMIADLGSLIFKTNVPEDQISYISENSEATIKLRGQSNSIVGYVQKIYPEKITLPTGENVYQVDIFSPDLAQYGKYAQAGSVLIKNRYDNPVILVPAWLVLNKQYVWVLDQNKPVLKRVKIGDTVGENTQIFEGLSQKDQIILNPSAVVSKKYTIL